MKCKTVLQFLSFRLLTLLLNAVAVDVVDVSTVVSQLLLFTFAVEVLTLPSLLEFAAAAVDNDDCDDCVAVISAASLVWSFWKCVSNAEGLGNNLKHNWQIWAWGGRPANGKPFKCH